MLVRFHPRRDDPDPRSYRIKQIIPIAILLAILVIGFHDGGEYASARRQLTEGTRQAAIRAASTKGDRNVTGRVAVETAAEHGVSVFAYDHQQRRVEVWGRIEVEDTWILHVITAGIEGRASGVPYTIDHSESAAIR